jgi:FkbM family methyltransferase
MRWRVGSSVHGCWLGHYEREKQVAVRRLVRPGMTVFDIGANAGFYTLAFSRLVGDAGHVWALEPLPENIRNLRHHLALNALRNVTVVEAAAAARRGVARFETAASNAMGHLSDRGELSVPTVMLDDMADRTGAMHLIKLDVEGAEGDVLAGGRRALERYRPVILLATHGVEQERRCIEILAGLGYHLHYLDDTPASSAPMTSDELIAMPAGRD